jgi:invasion protein IalB
MSFSSKRLAAALATMLMVGASAAASAAPRRTRHAAPAPAQSQPQPQPGQQPPGVVRVDLKPTQPSWTKVCGHDQVANKDICYTTRDFGQAPGQPPVLALAVYDVKGEDTRIVRLLLPVGLMLRPGFRFNVGKGATLAGDFEICFPNGCFAESRVDGSTINELRNGTIMNVSVKNQANNEVTFGVPLDGFGKAFDGPAIDPKILEAQQQQLQSELQKRAEQERKALEAQQQSNAAGSAPAQTK